MRIEKLFFLYWPAQRRFLQLLVTRGSAGLAALTVVLLRLSPHAAAPGRGNGQRVDGQRLVPRSYTPAQA
jgi:hypothetical protein